MLHVLGRNSELLICIKLLFRLSGGRGIPVQRNGAVPRKRQTFGNSRFMFIDNRCIAFHISTGFSWDSLAEIFAFGL
jgi:hypothetical protein